jgi:DNA ligase 1
MRDFISLFKAIDETSDSNIKHEALVNYFKYASPGDSVWAISLLMGRKIKRSVSIKKLQEWAIDISGTPQWLFDECLNNTRDLAETIALILPAKNILNDISLQELIEQFLIPLKNQSEINQKERVIAVWQIMNSMERYLWNKLLTGTFPLVVPGEILIKAISSLVGLNKSVISFRLSGNWNPSLDYYSQLISPVVDSLNTCMPYPFSVPVQSKMKVEDLGELSDWLIEWKLKGIRSQLIKRNNQVYVWSIDEDFLNDSFPKLLELGIFIPDGTVLDGIISTDIFIAFDLLEINQNDLRCKPLFERRELLEVLINNISDKRIILSEILKCTSWDNLKKINNDSRNSLVNGVILKSLNSEYRFENHNPADNESWYKWKKDPHYVNAVLLYAQKEQGSSLFKEFTFALWNEKELVPFAKSSIGLTEEEIINISEFIRNNTVEKFGPVRTVKPGLIFELEFEGIQKSSRRKSGFLVQSPRISRYLPHKKLKDVNSLNSLKSHINF